jgi:hypothetical protein
MPFSHKAKNAKNQKEREQFPYITLNLGHSIPKEIINFNIFQLLQIPKFCAVPFLNYKKGTPLYEYVEHLVKCRPCSWMRIRHLFTGWMRARAGELVPSHIGVERWLPVQKPTKSRDAESF